MAVAYQRSFGLPVVRFRGKVHYVMRVEAGNQGVHSCAVGDVGDGEHVRRHHTIEIGAVAR